MAGIVHLLAVVNLVYTEKNGSDAPSKRRKRSLVRCLGMCGCRVAKIIAYWRHLYFSHRVLPSTAL